MAAAAAAAAAERRAPGDDFEEMLRSGVTRQLLVKPSRKLDNLDSDSSRHQRSRSTDSGTTYSSSISSRSIAPSAGSHDGRATHRKPPAATGGRRGSVHRHVDDANGRRSSTLARDSRQALGPDSAVDAAFDDIRSKGGPTNASYASSVKETHLQTASASASAKSTMRKTSGFFRKTMENIRRSGPLVPSSAPAGPPVQLTSAFTTPSPSASPLPPASQSPPKKGTDTKPSTSDKRSQSTDRSSTWSLDWVGTMSRIEAEQQSEQEAAHADPETSARVLAGGTLSPSSPNLRENEPRSESPSPLQRSPRTIALQEYVAEPSTPTKASARYTEPDSSAARTSRVQSASPPKIQLDDSPRHASKEVPSVGLGLDTIRESRSREVSASAASASTTPEGDVPPLIAQTPSLSQQTTLPSLSVDGDSLSTSSEKARARQSVVGYPSASSSATASSISLTPAKPRLSDMSEVDAAVTEQNVSEQAADLARKCWDGDESFLRREKVAEWLGGIGQLNHLALVSYLANFDFEGLRLDLAFRKLCEKLYLKAETQQIDRILAEFSKRYMTNNPNTLYGCSDVVHIVAYTLLLLNTDLHVVESSSRMSRSQFVRNAMAGIQAASSMSTLDVAGTPAAPLDLSTGQPQETQINGAVSSGTPQTPQLPVADLSSSRLPPLMSGSVTSLSQATSPPPSSSADSLGNSLPVAAVLSPNLSPLRSRKSTSTPSESQTAFMSKPWQSEVESVLKEMYAAIRDRPIFQPQVSSTSNLSDSVGLSPTSPYSSIIGSRNASRRSQVSVTTVSGMSERSKRTSIRGILGSSTNELSYGRPVSPTASFATSFMENQSTTAYGSASLSPALQQSALHTPTFGFASNLSQSIIRESHTEHDDAHSLSGASVDDEDLALMGAPWAKEGLLHRKHYWETPNRRSRDNQWLQVFVVIHSGELKMFRFGQSSKSARAAGMGGGNWMTNASLVGHLSLVHALCTAMPAPGYNKQRPHVFVLTLSTGSSYFFEAGTADLVNEWVSTCNYWSARLSAVPLTGGVSNMEYGWNRIPSEDDDCDVGDTTEPTDQTDTLSIRSSRSVRSKMSRMGGLGLGDRQMAHGPTSANPNDRIYINEWHTPAPSNMASSLGEEKQIDALKLYLKHLAHEAEIHGALRKPMISLYSLRSQNAKKAQANWAKKQQHLAEETVKYSTYIEALLSAFKLKMAKLAERTVADLLEKADEVDDETMTAGDESNDSEPSAVLKTAPNTRPAAGISVDGSRPSISTTHSDVYVDAVGPMAE